VADPEYVLDHVGIPVADAAAARAFYERALEPLGFSIVMELADGAVLALGLPRAPQVWLSESEARAPVHLAFRAADRARVDAFHAAALAAGGRDNGPPGVRAHYHPNYYAAYVLDPDGNNVEAVCHAPPEAA
jgi:catechol 2,3-dioxygenase-like lactoylglutathione lyase family enzyme